MPINSRWLIVLFLLLPIVFVSSSRRPLASTSTLYQVGDIAAYDCVEFGEGDLVLPYDPDEKQSYDHVGIIIKGGTFEEARVVESAKWVGAREISLPDFYALRQNNDFAAKEVWRVDLPKEVREEAAEAAQKFVGASYPLVGFLGKGKIDGSYYCSELVWIAYQIAYHQYKGTDYKYGTTCYPLLEADDEGQNSSGKLHCRFNDPVTPSDVIYSKYTYLISSF